MFLWPKKRFPNVNRLRLHPHPFLPHLASFSLWLNHFAVALSHCFSLQISCSSRRWHLLDISINELQVQKKKKKRSAKNPWNKLVFMQPTPLLACTEASLFLLTSTRSLDDGRGFGIYATSPVIYGEGGSLQALQRCRMFHTEFCFK